jgi:hypothetical protein
MLNLLHTSLERSQFPTKQNTVIEVTEYSNVVKKFYHLMADDESANSSDSENLD